MISLDWPGGSPENTALIVAIVVGAYFIALWFAALVWTVRDIHSRSRDPVTQLVFALLVLAFNFPGLVLYIVLRPTRTLEEAFEHQLEEETLLHELRSVFQCPACDEPVEHDYLVCPQCAAPLRTPCRHCNRPLEADWKTCPCCAEPSATAPSPDPPPEPEPEPVATTPERPEPSDQPVAQES